MRDLRNPMLAWGKYISEPMISGGCRRAEGTYCDCKREGCYGDVAPTVGTTPDIAPPAFPAALTAPVVDGD